MVLEFKYWQEGVAAPKTVVVPALVGGTAAINALISPGPWTASIITGRNPDVELDRLYALSGPVVGGGGGAGAAADAFGVGIVIDTTRALPANIGFVYLAGDAHFTKPFGGALSKTRVFNELAGDIVTTFGLVGLPMPRLPYAAGGPMVKQAPEFLVVDEYSGGGTRRKIRLAFFAW